MMRALAAWFALLVGCSPSHDVRVLFGPDEDTLTIGFRCVDSGGTPLFARAIDARHVAIVIDLLTVDDGSFPGCRGEELLLACSNGRCKRDANRYCVDLDFDAILVDLDNADSLLALLSEVLHRDAPVISSDAPDVPTIVRAVATTQTCDAIGSGVLDPADAVGCAYSCPTLLDEVNGTISLSLDSLTTRCESLVRTCAAFPDVR